MKKTEDLIFQVCKDKRKTNNVIIPELEDPSIPQVVITVFVSMPYSRQACKFILPTRKIDDNKISLNNLIEGIAQIIPIEKHSISYCTSDNEEDDIYMFCGVYPLDSNVICELTPLKILFIKLRQHINTNHQLRLELYEDETENQHDDVKKMNHHVNINSKRAKERKIEDIIKKVYIWKKLYYEGVNDRNGKLIRLTLQDAAEKVEISKKSLDEYYNQLKFGKMFGFDFNKHKNDKVGVLRGFVKKQLENLPMGTRKNYALVNKKIKKVKKVIQKS